MRKRITGRGIVVQDNKILLMERWRDGLHYFSIPGGGVENDETVRQAAIRELMEEMGIVVSIEGQVFRVESEDSEHHIFLCSHISGQPRLLPDSPEARHQNENNKYEPRWVSMNELPDLTYGYWQPLKEHLITAAKDNFRGPCKTITF